MSDVQKGYTSTAIKLARGVLEQNIEHDFGTDFTDLAIDILEAVTGHVDFPVPDIEPERHALLGFQIIHEMTADEMLEEALAFQRGQWEKASKNQLKKFVIEARAHQHKARLLAEAQLEPEGFWPFGGGVATDEQA